ncbi:MAG: hypothetical protein WCE21_01705 [Candidatus Babeliales bacterium]
MKKCIVTFISYSLIISCISLLTHNNQLIASEHKKDLVAKGLNQLTKTLVQRSYAVIGEKTTTSAQLSPCELCDQGLEQLSESIEPSKGNFKQEVKKNELATACATLLAALRRAEEVTQITNNNAQETDNAHKLVVQKIITFFKTNELSQFLLMHGYVDNVLAALPYTIQDFDLTDPILSNDQNLPIYAKQYTSFFDRLHRAPACPKVNKEIMTHAVKIDGGKKIVRLSPDYTTLSCVTMKKGEEKEQVHSYALTPSFCSAYIGATGYLITEKDPSAYDSIPRIFTYISPTLTSVEQIQAPFEDITEIYLSPDEQKILCVSSLYNDKPNHVYDINTKRWLTLEYTNKMKQKSVRLRFNWNKESSAIIGDSILEYPESTYLWNVTQHNPCITDNRSRIKLALYNLWLANLKKDCEKSIDAYIIGNARRFNTIPLAMHGVDSDFITQKKEERLAFIQKYNLTELIEE